MFAALLSSSSSLAGEQLLLLPQLGRLRAGPRGLLLSGDALQAGLLDGGGALVTGGAEQPLLKGGVPRRRLGGVEVPAHPMGFVVEHERQVGHHVGWGEHEGGQVLEVPALHVHLRSARGERAVGVVAVLAGGPQVLGRLSNRRLGVGKLLLGTFVGGHCLGHSALQRLQPCLGELDLRRDLGNLLGCGGGRLLRLRDLRLGGDRRAGGRPAGRGVGRRRYGGAGDLFARWHRRGRRFHRRAGNGGHGGGAGQRRHRQRDRCDDGTRADPKGEAHRGIIPRSPADITLSSSPRSASGRPAPAWWRRQEEDVAASLAGRT